MSISSSFEAVLPQKPEPPAKKTRAKKVKENKFFEDVLYNANKAKDDITDGEDEVNDLVDTKDDTKFVFVINESIKLRETILETVKGKQAAIGLIDGLRKKPDGITFYCIIPNDNYTYYTVHTTK
jgi:hypothetical protein